MSDEFREDVKAVVHSHDLDAEDLRTLATDLQALADKWEAADETL